MMLMVLRWDRDSTLQDNSLANIAHCCLVLRYCVCAHITVMLNASLIANWLQTAKGCLIETHLNS